MTPLHEELYEHLMLLASNKIQPQENTVGVCAELCDVFEIPYFSLQRIVAQDYPLIEGATSEFPIYTDMKYKSAEEQYRCRPVREDLWHPDTKYGAARRAFCEWLASKLVDGSWNPYD